MMPAALLAALLLTTAACSRSPELPALPTDAVILAFGDSLTYGTGVSRGEDYPSELQRLSDRQVINAGIPGELTSEGRERLPATLSTHEPDLVVLIHGGNDLIHKLDSARIRDNLTGMVAAIRAHGASVVMLAVPKPGLLLRPAPLYEAVAERQEVPVDMDTLAALLRDPDLHSDAIHLNEEGYDRLAGAVHALLEETGALP